MEDTRPIWGFSEMTEAAFRKYYRFGWVVDVRAEWKFTSADTTENWLVIKNNKGAEMRLPEGWRRVLKFTGNSYNPGIFDLDYVGERMAKRLEEIDKWEAKNDRDRRDYDRLKAKFETGKEVTNGLQA